MRSTWVVWPSTISSASASPVAGPFIIPQHPCPVATYALGARALRPMIGLPFRDWFGERVAAYLEFILATPVIFWAALPFFHRGWTSIKTWHLNMWTLIMIGVGAAYGYSMIATFFPGLFPATLRMDGGHVPVYF